MNVAGFDWVTAVVVDCVGWVLWGVATGLAARRLDPARETWLTRPRPWERGGRAYRRPLRMSRWQHLLPEAGAWFAGGADKRRIGGRSTEALERYAAETRRAEYVHWLGVGAAPLFAVWNPAGLWLIMVAYALAANLPCIVSLRSNRLRIGRVLARRTGSGRTITGP